MRFLPMIFWMERKESHNFLENPHSHQLWSWSSQKKEIIPYPICSVVAVFKMLVRILNTLPSRIWDGLFFLFSDYSKSTVGEKGDSDGYGFPGN